MIPTNFSLIIGNDPIKNYLKRMVERNVVANSLLFAGTDGIGKSLFAQALAAELMEKMDPNGLHRHKIAQGNHPDIHHYRPEGKLGMHSIQSLRQFSDEVHLPPYEAKWKVFIIHEAERMLTYSANALLKTFEEPPSDTVIILLSHSPSALLPTIQSRCRTVYFQAISQAEMEQFLKQHYQLDENEVRKIAGLAHGSIAKAIQIVSQKENSLRHIILSFLVQGKFRTYKNLTEKVDALTALIEATKKEAETHAKEELCKVPIEHLTAHQQNTLEKELEGAAAMSQMQEVSSVFDVILSWYRDLNLLLVGGHTTHLINLDYAAEMEQALQKGTVISLEYIQKALEETRLSLQRSTALHICLENLFLKLNLV